MLQGVPRMGRRLEIALAAIVGFRVGEVAHEQGYRDQA
jgi:hypothetical protein